MAQIENIDRLDHVYEVGFGTWKCLENGLPHNLRTYLVLATSGQHLGVLFALKIFRFT